MRQKGCEGAYRSAKRACARLVLGHGWFEEVFVHLYLLKAHKALNIINGKVDVRPVQH